MASSGWWLARRQKSSPLSQGLQFGDQAAGTVSDQDHLIQRSA